MVDAEVEEALPGHPALPAAARVVSHQLLRRRQAEVQLELLQRLPELPGVVLLGRLPALDLLCDEALQARRGSWGSAVKKKNKKNNHIRGLRPTRPTLTFPLTKLATSSLFSKTDSDCSRLWSSQSQCLFTSSAAAPETHEHGGDTTAWPANQSEAPPAHR